MHQLNSNSISHLGPKRKLMFCYNSVCVFLHFLKQNFKQFFTSSQFLKIAQLKTTIPINISTHKHTTHICLYPQIFTLHASCHTEWTLGFDCLYSNGIQTTFLFKHLYIHRNIYTYIQTLLQLQWLSQFGSLHIRVIMA